jgi:hypothetical protein
MLTPCDTARMLNNMKPLDALLREWQESNRLRDVDAARLCGLKPQHWDLLVHGKRAGLRPKTFFQLSAGTGIPLHILMAAAEEMRISGQPDLVQAS